MSVRFAAVALFVAAPLCAQPLPDDRPAAFLSTKPAESFARSPASRVQNVFLRPNLDEQLFLHVRNPTEREQKLTLALATGPNDVDEFARVNVSVPARSTARVEGPKATPAPGDKPPEKPAPGTPLHGSLHLRLLDNRGDTIDSSALPVRVELPSQYVEAAARFEGEPGGATNKFIVALRDRTPARPFPGPPAKAQLVVDPTRIPGLVVESVKVGTFLGKLPPGGQLTLAAENLRFRQPGHRGVVAVTVDGVERAFLFETDFGGTAPQPYRDVRLAMSHPLYVRPGGSCPVKLEIDNAPRADATVEFGIDRADTGRFDTTTWKGGDRHEAVSVRWGGRDGGLTFISELHDYVKELDTAGLQGKRALRLRLLDPQGRELATEAGEVIVDATEPVVSRFRVMTKDPIRGKAVSLTAFGTDPESGIKEVLFFAGEPPAPDGKPTANGRVLRATPPDAANDPYTALLPVPDVKGRVTVGVRFVNHAGLHADATEEIVLRDPPPEKKPVGSIKVKVVQGTDERPQQNMALQLRDAKGNVLKDAATDAKGEYTFADVEPGKYVVAASRLRNQTKAQANVTVEANKSAEVTLKMKR